MLIIFTFLLFIISNSLSATSDFDNNEECTLSVKNLRCEYLRNPIGIEIANPRLSWSLVSEQRSQTQFAYQILVASRIENINKGVGDLWDTGKIVSDQNHNCQR